MMQRYFLIKDKCISSSNCLINFVKNLIIKISILQFFFNFKIQIFRSVTLNSSMALHRTNLFKYCKFLKISSHMNGRTIENIDRAS